MANIYSASDMALQSVDLSDMVIYEYHPAEERPGIPTNFTETATGILLIYQMVKLAA